MAGFPSQRPVGQWRGASTFSLICTWTNGWVNNRDAADTRRHRAYCYVIVMSLQRNEIYSRKPNGSSLVPIVTGRQAITKPVLEQLASELYQYKVFDDNTFENAVYKMSARLCESECEKQWFNLPCRFVRTDYCVTGNRQIFLKFALLGLMMWLSGSQ